MPRLAAVLAAAALALAPLSAAALTVEKRFTVLFEGAQEVPPVASAATGSGTAALWSLGGGLYKLSYDLLFDDTLDFGAMIADDGIGSHTDPNDVTRMHIHAAPRGVNGGVVYGLYNPLSDASAPGPSAVNIAAVPGGFRVWGEWNDGDQVGADTISSRAPGLIALALGEDAPLYFNVHTLAFPAGEIRAQLVSAPIPLPAAAPLLAVGLAALLALRRRA